MAFLESNSVTDSIASIASILVQNLAMALDELPCSFLNLLKSPMAFMMLPAFDASRTILVLVEFTTLEIGSVDLGTEGVRFDLISRVLFLGDVIFDFGVKFRPSLAATKNKYS